MDVEIIEGHLLAGVSTMPLRERTITLLGAVIVSGVAINPAEAHWCNNGSKLNNIERAICSDSGLINKDRELNSLYKTLGGRGNSRLKAAQRAWMSGRNGCASMECLHAYYDNRLNDLRVMKYGNRNTAAPTPAPPPVATFTPPSPPPVIVAPAPRSNESTGSGGLEKLPDLKDF